MQRVFKSSVLALTAMGLVALGSALAPGQSGSRNDPPERIEWTNRPAGNLGAAVRTAAAAGAGRLLSGEHPGNAQVGEG